MLCELPKPCLAPRTELSAAWQRQHGPSLLRALLTQSLLQVQEPGCLLSTI